MLMHTTDRHRAHATANCLLLLLVTALFASIAFADEPRLVPFQARLTDTSGADLTGVYRVTFVVYDAATGGTALWSEVHPSVSVIAGRLNVLLGSLASLDDYNGDGNPSDAVQFDRPRYVGIKVGADTNQEMVPRHQLVPAFHARTADHSMTSNHSATSDHSATSGAAVNSEHSATADTAANCEHSTTADVARTVEGLALDVDERQGGHMGSVRVDYLLVSPQGPGSDEGGEIRLDNGRGSGHIYLDAHGDDFRIHDGGNVLLNLDESGNMNVERNLTIGGYLMVGSSIDVPANIAAPNNVWGSSESTQGYGNGRYIGVTKTSLCPNGKFVVGLNVAYGGTCRGACDGDGGVVREISVICRDL